MKALILNGVVVDTAENEFEVAEPLYWVDCPDTVEAYTHDYVDNTFVAKPTNTPSTGTDQTIGLIEI